VQEPRWIFCPKLKRENRDMVDISIALFTLLLILFSLTKGNYFLPPDKAIY